ncbi:MAG: adenylate/guanylate cyclase domain-containing protein [Candidatus Sericytochromatia bacterium]|nr:adenylate/guanylate cyclase domain-containing protein [Candidatus Sericytochromatia bacterium]
MSNLSEAPLPVRGAYRDVTVLFSDLEGFTSMAERLPPEAVVALLNEYFAGMAEVVEQFRGRIDKYIGDAMLVVWEQEQAEGAGLATQAALRMQSDLAALQSKWLSEGKLPLKCRIGISSGKVIEGMIGGPARQERTVIGDAVNTASRLEALNKVYHTDIILGRSTYDLVAERACVRPLGIVTIKGRQEPLEVFALTGWGGQDLG